MGDAVVTFEQLVAVFPRITNRSKLFAKKILPLRASAELAALVAALMSDGHVEWYTSDGRPRTRHIRLYSSDKNECEWFLRLVQKVFGVEGKVQAYIPKYGYFKKQPYKAQVLNAAVARILILAGAPAGNKTEKEFLVPEWIMGGSREIKREFLRTFLSFEGGVPYRKGGRRHSFQMSLFMNKATSCLNNGLVFLSQIVKLLNFFGVGCSKIASRPHTSGFSVGKNTVYFTITGQKSIVNFYKNVGFLNPAKQARLEECVLDISKFHRLKSHAVCKLIAELKDKIGTDKKLASCVSNLTKQTYSNRQIEHFRRRESNVPLEVLWALIKIKKEKAILCELPSYIQTLYNFNPNVPAPL